MTKSQIEFNTAISMKLDNWVPACGGTEEIMVVRNKRILYCFNQKQNRHAYLDVDSDMIMTDDEYFNLIGI